MKKINIILIIISIILSIYISFTQELELVNIAKNLSIIITINAVYIIKKVFKLNISEELNFIYILFIILTHLIGVNFNLFVSIYWFDKFTHFVSGLLSSILAIYILRKFKKNDNNIFNYIFIISFALMVASLWEIMEYTFSCILPVDPQKVELTGVNDTMGDIIVAFLGSIIISISYNYEIGNKKLLLSKLLDNIK